MAITLGAGPVTGGTPASSVTSFTLSLTGTTAGRSIVAGVAWSPFSSFTDISSIQCSGESDLTWVTSATTQGTTGRKVRLAYLANNTGGGSKTITINLNAALNSQNYAVAFAFEIDGADTSSFVDAFNTATGASTTPTVNVTSTTANACVVGINVNDWSDPTPTGGYTNIALSAGGQRNGGSYLLDAGAAGSKTVGYTTTSSSNWAVQAVAIKALTTSPTVTPGTGSLALTGTQPGGGVPLSVTPTTGSVAVTGQQAQLSSSLSPLLTPTAASLSLTGSSPTILSVAGADITLLAHTITASGTSFYNSADIALLGYSISATGVQSDYGSASVTLLAHTIEAGGNTGATLPLLAHTISAGGVNGAVGNLAATLLAHSLSATGQGSVVGNAAIQLLAPSLSATGVSGNVGTLARSLAWHRISAEGVSGNVGTAAIDLAVHELTALAYPEGVGTAQIELLTHFIEASGFASVEETYRAWVMNTRTGALSQYEEFQFNSIAKFGNVYIAAGPQGISVLGGDLDAGEKIDASILGGSLNYGSSMLKRMARLYVSASTDGDLIFTAITQQGGARDYLLQANGITGEQQRRVQIGRGPKSVRWQFGVSNRNGSDFELSSILAYPHTLRRRIQ